MTITLPINLVPASEKNQPGRPWHGGKIIHEQDRRRWGRRPCTRDRHGKTTAAGNGA